MQRSKVRVVLRQINLMSLLQNILSGIGTFVTISSLSVLFIQGIVCFMHRIKFDLNKPIDYRIILVGIGIAILLIPCYYIPS